MQKLKAMFQKIKERTNKLFEKISGFVAGAGVSLCFWGAMTTFVGVAFIFAGTAVNILPVVVVAAGTAVMGGLTRIAFKKAAAAEDTKLQDATFGIGLLLGGLSPYIALALFPTNVQKPTAENIFTTPGTSVTQTFNQKAPSLKDGFTYKGVTYKVPAQDIMKKAA